MNKMASRSYSRPGCSAARCAWACSTRSSSSVARMVVPQGQTSLVFMGPLCHCTRSWVLGDMTSTDAIVLLKTDHKEILKTFTAFEKVGDKAHAEKGRLVKKMIELLTVHTYIENEVMYPRVRALLP